MTGYYESRLRDILFEINRASEQSNNVVATHKDNEAGIHRLHGFMVGSLGQIRNMIEVTLEYGGELKEVRRDAG